eukprot:6187087-Pleurochrysis_carterae.AAC.2
MDVKAVDGAAAIWGDCWQRRLGRMWRYICCEIRGTEGGAEGRHGNKDFVALVACHVEQHASNISGTRNKLSEIL